MHALLHSVPPSLKQATTKPCLHHMSGSVSCGATTPFSWVLVHTSFCLCPQESVSPVLSSHGSMVGLMVTSSKRTYAIPKSAAPRAPAHAAGHCWPVPPQETLRHSSDSVCGLGVRFVPFSGLSSSGDQLLGERIVPHGPCILISSPSHLLGFPGAPWEHRLRGAMCLLWRANLRLQPSWQMSAIQNLRKTWLAVGSPLTAWWKICLWDWDCSSPLPSGSGCHKHASLPLGREGPVCSQLALLWYLFNPLFCEYRLSVRLLV